MTVRKPEGIRSRACIRGENHFFQNFILFNFTDNRRIIVDDIFIGRGFSSDHAHPVFTQWRQGRHEFIPGKKPGRIVDERKFLNDGQFLYKIQIGRSVEAQGHFLNGETRIMHPAISGESTFAFSLWGEDQMEQSASVYILGIYYLVTVIKITIITERTHISLVKYGNKIIIEIQVLLHASEIFTYALVIETHGFASFDNFAPFCYRFVHVIIV